MEVAIGKFSKIITLDFQQTKICVKGVYSFNSYPRNFCKTSPSSLMHAEHIGYNVNKIRWQKIAQDCSKLCGTQSVLIKKLNLGLQIKSQGNLYTLGEMRQLLIHIKFIEVFRKSPKRKKSSGNLPIIPLCHPSLFTDNTYRQLLPRHQQWNQAMELWDLIRLDLLSEWDSWNHFSLCIPYLNDVPSSLSLFCLAWKTW